MQNKRKILLFVLLMATMLCHPVMAQFNPVKPAEPNLYYKVKVSADHTDVAWLSGTGSYLANSQVYVNASLRNSNYTFLYWTLNGERYSDNQSFYYTTTGVDANFVAHYSYTPSKPQEPVSIFRNQIFLEAEPASACSFSRSSGEKATVDEYVNLRTYPNQGFEFLGWYDGNTLVSSSTSFNYLMPDRNVTLVARYKYNPVRPSEPSGNQSDVQTKIKGDVNMDGVVDVTDAVAVINEYLQDNNETDWIDIADMNGDGLVDVTDVVIILNDYLKKQ